MTRKNPNKTNFHYRADMLDESEKIISKYFFTLKEMCEEFETSTFTIYQMINFNKKPRNKNLKGVQIYHDVKPAIISIKSEYY